MIVVLTEDEVRRAIARAAVEKAHSPMAPWRWSERVGVVGLHVAGPVTAFLQDGELCRVVLAWRVEPEAPSLEEGEVPF